MTAEGRKEPATLAPSGLIILKNRQTSAMLQGFTLWPTLSPAGSAFFIIPNPLETNPNLIFNGVA